MCRFCLECFIFMSAKRSGCVCWIFQDIVVYIQRNACICWRWKVKFFLVENGEASEKVRELEEIKPITFETFILESSCTASF